ncbi:MAG: UDP-glucose dehydrogenase family protein [Acidimicrobiia bacterium]
MSSIAVVGAGYVGLTTAACLAHLGHDVACADVDAEKVDRLSKAEIPILEEGLPALVAEGLEAHRLRFVVGAATAAARAEFVFLCVPTPQGAAGAADLSVVEDVVREIASVLQPGTVVVNKSTMPVGSTRLVERILGESGAVVDEVGVASNPEFLREGTAVRDFLHPNRVVIGCEDAAVAVRVSELYSNVHAPILVTDPASAEMIKYASNAFLATKISFINAVANLCETVNADVREVALGMGYDSRIGFEFLHPGPGYGGSCFPKDTAALLHTAGAAGYDFSLLDGVVEVNRRQHERIVAKIRAAAGGSLAGVSVGVWGLTFKANTDDLRDSPSLAVAARVLEEGARVRAYDPAAGEEAGRRLPGLDVVADPYEACDGARVLAVLTEWDEFRWLDFERVATTMDQPAVVDARNLLDPLAMRRRGFAYQGVGR